MAKKMKSDAKLRQRLALLEQRGLTPLLHKGPPVSELLDLIGDLTLAEVCHMGEIAGVDMHRRLRDENPPPPLTVYG